MSQHRPHRQDREVPVCSRVLRGSPYKLGLPSRPAAVHMLRATIEDAQQSSRCIAFVDVAEVISAQAVTVSSVSAAEDQGSDSHKSELTISLQ